MLTVETQKLDQMNVTDAARKALNMLLANLSTLTFVNR